MTISDRLAADAAASEPILRQVCQEQRDESELAWGLHKTNIPDHRRSQIISAVCNLDQQIWILEKVVGGLDRASCEPMTWRDFENLRSLALGTKRAMAGLEEALFPQETAAEARRREGGAA